MPNPTAAMLVIGDEILSGRTRDANMHYLAGQLTERGIDLKEVRVVGDEAQEITDATKALSARYDHVFTSGGIGPTHDDITADSIARAFGVGIDVREDALAIIEHWYEKTGTPLTETRKRMARIPDGASLIENPVTGAPGFQTGNVFTLAGVPKIARGMLEDIAHRIEGGAVTRSRSVKGEGLREGDIAVQLGELQTEYPDVSIGSYPYFLELQDGKLRRGTQLVVRATDDVKLDEVITKITALVAELGHEPELA